MRTSILPRVRKVYRVIPGGLAAGSYTVQIRNNYDPVIFEDGSKVRRAPGPVFLCLIVYILFIPPYNPP